MVLLFYKSQDDLTSSFSQTQKADLILKDNDSSSKKIYLMKERKFTKQHRYYFSKIHSKVYKLANSKKSISRIIGFALDVIEESLKRYGYDLKWLISIFFSLSMNICLII